MVTGAGTERSLWPWAGSGFGPLAPLLVAMTVVTGIVDAVSYLALGHVFVANMTGNVVFLGFALAGAGGLSVPASLVALAAFLCGAAAGGRIGARFGDRRFAHLRAANSVTATLLVAAAGLAVPTPKGVAGGHERGLELCSQRVVRVGMAFRPKAFAVSCG